ncbi:MAG: type II secretion system protein GspJ [Opitutaceae bacterium]
MTRRRTAFGSGREKGFTLLELLIATAIGAVVLLVINTTFFSALRLHNTTHASIDTDLALQRALGIIRKDLAGIMLPAATQTATTLAGPLQTETFSSTALDGSGGERVTPDMFTNSGRIDGWTSFSEVQIVSYYLTPATDGGSTKNLVRLVNRNLLSAAEPLTDEQTLLPGVTAAEISFYDGASWTNVWDSTASGTLPSAIKFSLTLALRDGDTMRPSPAPVELVVPILVTTTASQQEATAAATGQ